MRANGGLPREQGDVRGRQCVQHVNFDMLITNTRLLCPDIDVINTMDYLTQCHRLVFHIRQVMIIPVNGYDVDVGLMHRIRYMLGDFSEKQWLSKIKARVKIEDIRKCLSSLFTMCANTLEDLLNNISVCSDTVEFTNYFHQLQELNKYVADNILKLKQRFKVKMESFDSGWNVITV
jgi:hypothetical protein